MTVCTMYEIYIKFILNCVTKWTGMEQLTFISIFVKVGYYPLLALACTCCLIQIVIVYCI